MDDTAHQKDASSVLTEIPRYESDVYRQPPAAVAPERGIPRINLLLFLFTLLTTTTSGAMMAGATLSLEHPIDSLFGLTAGLSFSIPLMAILLAHEMGHFLTSRYNGVDASYPYFIPVPFPSLFVVGTFGAFIRIRSMPRTRSTMFDIAAAGPWAGIIVAIPCMIIGLGLSDVQPLAHGTAGGFELGNSILFWGLARWTLGVNPSLVSINLHPMAFAGWLGGLITTLNLLPVGQLDGGHVIYALLPHRHRTISKLFVLSCVLMVIVPLMLGLDFWAGWLVWAVLAVALGLGHPSTVDRDAPLDPRRRIAAWMTVALFIITFSPVPISITPTQPPDEQQEAPQSYDIMHRLPGPGATPKIPGVIRI